MIYEITHLENPHYHGQTSEKKEPVFEQILSSRFVSRKSFEKEKIKHHDNLTQVIFEQKGKTINRNRDLKFE